MASRTIEHQFDRIVDIVHFVVDTPHFIIDALNPVIDPRYLIVDVMSDLQELRGCHPNFLLSQLVQSTERVFNIRLSNQLLEKLF